MTGARGEGICCIFVLNDPVMKKLLPIIVLLLSACGRNMPDAGQFCKPGIIALKAMDITDCGATLVAEVNNPGLIAEQGFKVWPDGGDVMEIQATLAGNRFTAAVSNLSAGCEYHFVAYAGNGYNLDISSDEGVFSTLKREEQVPPDGPDTPPDNPDTPPDTPQNPATPATPDTPDTPPADPTYIDFPDGNLSAWMLWFFDEDKDGRLSTAEAAKVTTVNISTEETASLAGIENLPNLTSLDATGSGANNRGLLTSLDLSHNTKLQHVHLIYNRIGSLTLGEMSKLTYLDLDYNELAEFDPRPYKQQYLLMLSYNNLKTLDVTGLDNLDELHCRDNPIESLTLSSASLRYIDCSGTAITELDLSRCPKLSSLDCSRTEIATLDLSGCLKINDVDCSDCPYLTTIYLAKGQVLGSIRKPENVSIVHYE